MPVSRSYAWQETPAIGPTALAAPGRTGEDVGDMPNLLPDWT